MSLENNAYPTGRKGDRQKSNQMLLYLFSTPLSIQKRNIFGNLGAWAVRRISLAPTPDACA